MHYLIYVSQAEAPMPHRELAKILASSRAWNEAHGVTGLLIYKLSEDGRRGNFMQILEGEKVDVQAAFARITADPRHHTKIVLEEGEVAARAFPDWSMGFRNLEPGELAGHAQFRDLGEETFGARARAGTVTGALELMRSFYELAD